MFRKFFQALANVTAALDQMATSVREATENFRSNLGLDDKSDTEQLEHNTNGKRKSTTRS